MATSDWSIPTGKAITGATYIKDTDDNIAAIIEDLVDWCNNANGTYNDYTLTGLRTDFLSVSTAQAITSVKTIDTLGAIDFTNGELRIGGVAVTSTAAELNLLDGVTSTTDELNLLDGVTATTSELNVLDGVTATTAELNILDGVTATATDLNKTSNIVSGTYTPTVLASLGFTSISNIEVSSYIRVGDIVNTNGSFDFAWDGSTTNSYVDLSLPVASSFTNSNEGFGTCSLTDDSTRTIISGFSNNAIRIVFNTPPSNGTVFFTFQYRII